VVIDVAPRFSRLCTVPFSVSATTISAPSVSTTPISLPRQSKCKKQHPRDAKCRINFFFFLPPTPIPRFPFSVQDLVMPMIDDDIEDPLADEDETAEEVRF
jgi:hypothetical protein